MLDAVTAAPAFIRNGRMDLLAGNRLARAFYVDGRPERPSTMTAVMITRALDTRPTLAYDARHPLPM